MNGNGGGGMIVLILIIFLIAAGVGGYFGYTKWWVPKQCVGQDPDKTSNVSTFMYDSKKGVCVANVCIDGYGDAATGGLAVKGVCTLFTPKARTYSAVAGTGTGNPPVGGKCTGTDGALTAFKTTTDTTAVTCGASCDTLSGCSGYDWNATANPSCNLYTSPAPTSADTTAGTLCLNNPTIST